MIALYRRIYWVIAFTFALANKANAFEGALELGEPGFGGLQLSFLKDSVSQQEGSFSFNTLKISNTSTEEISFHLMLQVPESWQLLSDPTKNYTLAAGQNIMLPIRLSAASKANSNLKYLIYAVVKDIDQKQELKAFYYASVEPLSKWTMTLATPQVFFESGVSETYFSIRIENSGNVSEELSLDYTAVAAFRLFLPEKIIIKPEKDTTLIVKAQIDTRQNISIDQTNIIIVAKNAQGKDKSVLQQLTPLSSIIKQNKFRWYTIPMYIEVLGQDMTNPNRSLAFNAGGGLSLNKGRSINFTYRSDYISSSTQQVGSLANIGYSSNRLKLSVGDQSEFYANVIEGRGLKAYYKQGNAEYESIVVKKKDQDINNYGLRNILLLAPGQKLTNIIAVTDNNVKDSETMIYKSEYDIAFNQGTRLTTEAGYGIENINETSEGKTSLKGQSISSKFQSHIRKMMFNSYGNYSSKYYPTLSRGVFATDNELRFLLGDYSVGAQHRYTNRKPRLFDNGAFYEPSPFITKQYELKFGLSNKGFNTNFVPGYIDEYQDSVSTRTVRIQNSSQFNVYKSITMQVFANASRTQVYDRANINPFNTLNSRITIQNPSFGLITRYDAGPYLTYDIIKYMEDGIYPKKVYLTPFYETTMAGGRMFMRLQSDYIRELHRDETSFSLRTDVSYSIIKYGLRLKVYCTYNPNNIEEKILINTGIRKNFVLPIAGAAKYNSLNVVLYKDLNNNAVYDPADELIPRVIVLIDNKYFVTDEKGEVSYKNITPANYDLNVTSVSSLQGWISKNGTSQIITVGNNTRYFVPFIRSKYITGKIQLSKDKYSPYNLELDNIRITAIGQGGKEYSTFTNDKGYFFLNLPADIYQVRINTTVFGEIYEVVNNSYSINLLDASSYDVIFEVKEKRRKMNIRRN